MWTSGIGDLGYSSGARIERDAIDSCAVDERERSRVRTIYLPTLMVMFLGAVKSVSDQHTDRSMILT